MVALWGGRGHVHHAGAGLHPPLKFIPLPLRDIYFHIVHVQDLARASIFLLDAEGVAGKAFNCGEDHPKTLEQQTNAFLKLYNVHLPAFKWRP